MTESKDKEGEESGTGGERREGDGRRSGREGSGGKWS